MKIASWNIRGSNCPTKHSEVKDFLRNNRLDILALLETRVKHKQSSRIIQAKFKDWTTVCNYSKHYNGRIWVFFNPKTTDVLNKVVEAQFIPFKFHHFESNLVFFMSMVYGSNNVTDREQLWDGLQRSSTADPWIVLGDFNVVTDPTEKLSNTPPVLQEMTAFNNCLSLCHLEDIASSDRKIKKRFNFLNSWIGHPDYISTVAEAWKTDKKEELIHEEKIKIQEYSKLKAAELSILSQRAKIKHIQEADSSSKYFFARISARKHQQQVGAIKDKSGPLHLEPDQINKAFQDYYINLLGHESLVQRLDDDFLVEGATISPSESSDLDASISLKEIKDAIFSMDSNSSP
ncbi:uncharacterized protein LOC141613486 [Silene latifolia]|uniref:uncharacterized protein LOC141613486 n=1 Tax=Silene latifolia TaxID=37657 RepID=UPI003D77A20D